MKKEHKEQLKAMGIIFAVLFVLMMAFHFLSKISSVLAWIFCLVGYAIALLYFKKHPVKQTQEQIAANAYLRDAFLNVFQSPEKKRKRKESAYRDILSKLPSDLIRKIHKLLGTAWQNMGLPTEDLPNELWYAIGAANAVIKSESYGTINEAQRLKIEQLIEDFAWEAKTGIPAFKQAVNSLYGSDGLGFDLITNSAASAGLYAAMNAHDKIKGHEQRICEFKQHVEQKVVSLLNGIQQVLSDGSEMPIEESPVKKASTKENPTSGVSAADEILKFKELLDAGAITQEEFEAKKKQLLGL